MNNIKYIYEFSIFTEREIDKTEKTEVEGVVTTVTTKVKEKVPYYFAFKKPSRSEREDAEAYRVSQWGEYVKKGVLPEAVLLKTYANYGGILSDDQRKEYQKMRVDLIGKMEDYQIAKIGKDDIKALELMNEIVVLRDQIVNFEREQSTFFENTAEAKSRNKLIEYLILTLTQHRDSTEKPYTTYFNGSDIPAKYDQLEQLEESENEIYIKARDRLAFIASLYVSLNGNVKKEDVDQFADQLSGDTASVEST